MILSGCADKSTIVKAEIDIDDFQKVFHSIVEKVSPSVVAINTLSENRDVGFGTGVIIDKSGLILTSEHVISGADKISVLFLNQKIYSAEVVSADQTSDLAVIKVIKAVDLKPIEFGDSDKLQVGDIVLAMGNAFGHSSHDGKPTVTQGIVSALNRLATTMLTSRRYWNAIQHDASVNPGNSGGPLIDIHGKMIGLNGVINSKSGNNAGVSFAVPVNIIKKFLPKLKRGEKIEHPFIGLQDLSNVLSQINNNEIRGVQIGFVSTNTPAYDGGLQSSDIIIKIDDKLIQNTVDLYNWLYNKDPNDLVKFEVIRIDTKKSTAKIITVEFKLGTLPTEEK